jgi:hypothetical protein
MGGILTNISSYLIAVVSINMVAYFSVIAI